MNDKNTSTKTYGIVGIISAALSIIFPIISLVKIGDYSGISGFFKDSSGLYALPAVGAVLAVIGIVASAVGYSKKERTFSVIGLIVSVLSIALSIYAFVSIGNLVNIYNVEW